MTDRDLEERLRRLSPEQRRLLERRLHGAPTARSLPADDDPPPTPGLAHLSPEQEEAWAMYAAAPGAPHNLVPTVLCLRGPLDAGALERSLDEVVRRHHALRASIVLDGGRPFQRFAADVPVGLPTVDLGGVPEEEREARALAAAMELLRERFELTGPAPVWRSRLLRLGPEDHVWALALPGVFVDGVARGVVVREVMAVYEALSAGRPSPLAPAGIAYPDVLRERRRWLRGPEAAADLAHWRDRLTGMRPLDLFPGRAERAPGFPRFGTRRWHELPAPAAQRVALFREREGVTLFMAWLALLAAVLSPWARSEDVVVATAISTRGDGPWRDVVGNFTSTMLLRCRVPGDPTFRELAHLVRDVSLAAQARSSIPLLPVLQALGLAGRLASWDANNVAMGLLVHVTEAQTMGDVDARFVPVDTGKADGTLTAYMPDRIEERTRALIEYDGALFDEDAIARFEAWFDAVLDRGTEDPGRRLSELLPGSDR